MQDIFLTKFFFDLEFVHVGFSKTKYFFDFSLDNREVTAQPKIKIKIKSSTSSHVNIVITLI